MVDAIIVSSLVHNTHTWCNMTDGNGEAVSKKPALAYASAVPKRVTRIDDKFYKLMDDFVLTIIKRHDIQHQVRRKRLLSLPRLLDQGAFALIMVLDATLSTPGSFVSMLCRTFLG